MERIASADALQHQTKCAWVKFVIVWTLGDIATVSAGIAAPANVVLVQDRDAKVAKTSH